MKCKILGCAIAIIITILAKIILRSLAFSDSFDNWLNNASKNKEFSFALYIFLTSYIEYVAFYIAVLFSLKSTVNPSTSDIVDTDNQDGLRFKSNKTSLVESLSGDDSDSKHNASFAGQTALINLKMNDLNSAFSPKRHDNEINVTTTSALSRNNPFDDDYD